MPDGHALSAVAVTGTLADPDPSSVVAQASRPLMERIWMDEPARMCLSHLAAGWMMFQRFVRRQCLTIGGHAGDHQIPAAVPEVSLSSAPESERSLMDRSATYA
jgi:hypothetical protein